MLDRWSGRQSATPSVGFPAFILGHDPTRRIICVSYSGDLARKHSNDFRAVIEAPWYRSLFPTTRIGPYKNSETEIEMTARGFRLATSVGGTLTGRGGDTIILNDPLKPDDACRRRSGPVPISGLLTRSYLVSTTSGQGPSSL
jgi:hypothetical protein